MLRKTTFPNCTDEPGYFELSEAQHATLPRQPYTGVGLSAEFHSYVMEESAKRIGGQVILKKLKQKFTHEGSDLNRLPKTARQIDEWIGRKRKLDANGNPIPKFSSLIEVINWGTTRLVRNKEQFDAIDDEYEVITLLVISNHEIMTCNVMFLNCNVHVFVQVDVEHLTRKVDDEMDGPDGAGKETYASPILVLTTKRQLRIFMSLLNRADGNRMLLSTDTSFRLVSDNSKVVNYGLVVRVVKQRKITHPCLNFLHTWCGVENANAASLSLEMMKRIPILFFGYSSIYRPPAVVIDRSLALKKALEQTWGKDIITTCFPHVLHDIDRQVLATKTNERRGVLLADVRFLHEFMYSDSMMNLMLGVMQGKWTEMGEGQVAGTFCKIYGQEPFNRFYVTACRIVGVSPSNTSMEGNNRIAKVCLGVGGLYLPVNRFLEIGTESFTAMCPEPEPTVEMVCLHECLENQ